MISLQIVEWKKSDEEVFLQYYKLAVRDLDRDIATLKERKSRYTEAAFHRLHGDIQHLCFKASNLNKTELVRELHAKRKQLNEIHTASLKAHFQSQHPEITF
jgi:hypothetical protein